MKNKFKFLLIPSVVALTMPLAITSCNQNSISSEAKIIYQTAVEEFKNLCQINRISNEDSDVTPELDNLNTIRQYLTDVVNGVLGDGSVKRDKAGNIWFDIEPSTGYENYKKLMIQGHMDMVWVTAEGYQGEEGKPIIVEDKQNGRKCLHSKSFQSNIGADDGQAIGIILSLVKHHNDFKHGGMRFLLTVDEETTVRGARSLGDMEDGRHVNIFSDGYDYLINDDAPNEDSIYVSSAGVFNSAFGVWKFNTSILSNETIYTIKLSKFKGGHSATVDQGQANPFCVLGSFLANANNQKGSIKLSSLSTTDKAMNIIPSDSKVTFASSLDKEQIKSLIEQEIQTTKNSHPIETDIKYELTTSTNEDASIISEDDSAKLIKFMNTIWFGPFSFFQDGTIESSANIVPFRLDLTKSGEKSGDKETNAQFLVYQTPRYNTENKKIVFESLTYLLQENLTSDFPGEGFDPKTVIDTENESPVWERKTNNPLEDIACKAISNQGLKPKIKLAPGASECSYFCLENQNPNINQLNWGPDTPGEHSITEILYLDSYQRYIQELIDVVKAMNF